VTAEGRRRLLGNLASHKADLRRPQAIAQEIAQEIAKAIPAI
jgi:hypothetical protein